MDNVKIRLVDKDYIVKAKTEIGPNSNDGFLAKFFQQINEELIIGETASLEIEEHGIKSCTLEICRQE